MAALGWSAMQSAKISATYSPENCDRLPPHDTSGPSAYFHYSIYLGATVLDIVTVMYRLPHPGKSGRNCLIQRKRSNDTRESVSRSGSSSGRSEQQSHSCRCRCSYEWRHECHRRIPPQSIAAEKRNLYRQTMVVLAQLRSGWCNGLYSYLARSDKDVRNVRTIHCIFSIAVPNFPNSLVIFEPGVKAGFAEIKQKM